MPEEDRIKNWKRQLDRMVKDEDGRRLLCDSFGLQMVPKTDDTPRASVLVLVPCNDRPHPDARYSWELMIAEARKVANVHRAMIYGHSIVHWVRNEMIARALQDKVGFTHVLFVDDDIEVAPDSLVRLLSHNKDIVGALTTLRADPPIPTLRRFDEPSGDFVQRLQWKQGGLIETDAVGTGMILISKDALQKIGEFYLDCGYEKYIGMNSDAVGLSAKRRHEHDTTKDDRWRLNALWFQCLPALNGRGEYGEDMSFCLKAKLTGIQVYCDTAVTPLHHGDYGYGIADFFAHKRQLIDATKARGEYMEADPGADLKPVLSIVVPLYNQLEFTRECVTTLLENTVSSFQLVLVDDGSTDGTRDWIRELSANWGSLTHGNADLKIVFNPANLGVNKSWNEGLKASRGDYIAICNNDLAFAPGWDKPLIEALEADSTLGIVSPCHSHGEEKPADWPAGGDRRSNPADLAILGACFLFHRSLIDEIGYVPEAMLHYYGDDWMVWAARQAGKSSKHISASYVHHFFTQTTKHLPDWTSQWDLDRATFREIVAQGFSSKTVGAKA